MYIHMLVIRVQLTEQISCSFSELCDNLRVFNFFFINSTLVKAEAFKIPNDMVHVSNPNYRYNVKLAEKIHPHILSMK